MKHIRLFENFEDVVDQTTRDIFGLTSEFIITYTKPVWGGEEQEEYCKIKGPLENYEAVKPIIDRIQQDIEQLAENERSSDGKYIDDGDIDDLFYENDYYGLDKFGYHVYYSHGRDGESLRFDHKTGSYIKEGYNDDISSTTRDIFGLIHTNEVHDLFGPTGIVISGPSEESVKANTIVREIELEIHRRLPGIHAAPRKIWVEIVNAIVRIRKSDLSEIGYKIDTWYNGAESPELSR